jgi:hypothetical protein
VRGGLFTGPVSSVKRRAASASASDRRRARGVGPARPGSGYGGGGGGYGGSGGGARPEGETTDYEDAHSYLSADSLTYQDDGGSGYAGGHEGGGGYGGGLGALGGWDDESDPHAPEAFPWAAASGGGGAAVAAGKADARDDYAPSVTFAATAEFATEGAASPLSPHSLGVTTVASAGLEPSRSLAPSGDTSNDHDWARGGRGYGGGLGSGVTRRRGGGAASPALSERSLSQASASAWAEDNRRGGSGRAGTGGPLRFGDGLEERSGQPDTTAEGHSSGTLPASRRDDGDRDGATLPSRTLSGGVMEFDFASPQDSSAAKRKAGAFAARSAARAADARAKALSEADLARATLDAAAESSSSGGADSAAASPGPFGTSLNSSQSPGSALSGGVEKLAARLAAGGDGSVAKVPLKEAKARSARLFQALPEVAAARQKETDAQARLDRIAMAKADDKARRLASADKKRAQSRRL